MSNFILGKEHLDLLLWSPKWCRQWGVWAESSRGTFASRRSCPLERRLLSSPALAKTNQLAGAAAGRQHSSLRTQTLLVRGMAVSWWVGLVLGCLGWRMSLELHQTDGDLVMALSASSAKQSGIISSL